MKLLRRMRAMTLGAPAAVRRQELRAETAINRLRSGLDAQERAMDTLDEAFAAGGNLGDSLDRAGQEMRHA